MTPRETAERFEEVKVAFNRVLFIVEKEEIPVDEAYQRWWDESNPKIWVQLALDQILGVGV